jgi:hypothetical protein
LRDCRSYFGHVAQIAFKKFSARINGAAMSLAQIVENGDLMPFIEKQLCANAADITGTANNEDLHATKFRRTWDACQKKA